jgi:LysR family transcriptional regulator of gallate degradation
MMSDETDITQHIAKVRAFREVATTRSFTRAGEHLFKTSSAVTRAIVALERALNVPLFERTSRGLLASAYGKLLFSRAERIETLVQTAYAEVEMRDGAHHGVDHLLSGRKLELLIYIADLRSISAAAAQLNMTAAGVSMALARAESALGQPLFRRALQGMVATDIAEQLILMAKRVFAELRHLRSELSALSGEITGSVIVGSTPVGRAQLLPGAISSAITNYPRLYVSTVEGPYDDLIFGLRNGSIDMVFGVLRPADKYEGLVTEPLYTERLSVVARATHPLAKRKRLSLRDVVHEKWIMPRRTAVTRHRVEACFRKLGLEPPTPSVETGDPTIIRQLLFTSDMLAVTYPNQLDHEIQSKTILALPVTLNGTSSEVGLIMREGMEMPPAALTLLIAIRACAAVSGEANA